MSNRSIKVNIGINAVFERSETCDKCLGPTLEWVIINKNYKNGEETTVQPLFKESLLLLSVAPLLLPPSLSKVKDDALS